LKLGLGFLEMRKCEAAKEVKSIGYILSSGVLRRQWDVEGKEEEGEQRLYKLR
jgi:hypothetical protein